MNSEKKVRKPICAERFKKRIHFLQMNDKIDQLSLQENDICHGCNTADCWSRFDLTTVMLYSRSLVLVSALIMVDNYVFALAE